MGEKKKMTILLDDQVSDMLAKKARAEGFGKASVLARCLIVRGLNDVAESQENVKTLHVRVENYKEIASYVREKKFGKPEYFAAYAMEYYMNKNQLSEAQKARVRESVES